MLFTLLAGAVVCLIKLQLIEDRRLAKKKPLEERDQQLRVKRIRQLSGKR
jgi:hypothetical protein